MKQKENRMSEQPIKFIHIRAVEGHSNFPSNFGGLTVAYTYCEDCIRYAVARVYPTDRFSRTKGREVSTERLGQYISEVTDVNCGIVTVEDILNTFDHYLGKTGTEKLNVADFDWFIVVQTIKGLIVDDKRFNRGVSYIYW
jgi:hypothetical protein